MNDNIMLSIVIISYNQERYIRDAIESVLNQKVNFKYEILLADDCSPDNTGKIMKEYAKKYPKLIRILDRKKNLGATKNQFDACIKSKGKYITILEGDDYWCDENKIQLQVDFLEKNKEYIGVAHIQEGRNLENKILGYFPKKIKNDYTINGLEELINKNYIYSSSTNLYRNIYSNIKNRKDIEKILSFHSIIGDEQMCCYLCSLGKIYVMKKPMMVYRMRNNDGASNFNSTNSISDIELSYLNINTKLEKFFDYKYSFYNKIKKNYTLGVAYNICKFKFKDIKKFNKLCPKKYKLKIILLFPITCIQILYKRYIRK